VSRTYSIFAAGLVAAGLTSGVRTLAAATMPRVTPLTTRDIRGAAHTLPEPGKRATVLIFIAHDCPICNSYAPEIGRLAAKYNPRGISFDLVYAEPGFTNADAVAHEKAYSYTLPAFTSPWRTLVRAAGVTATPEAVALAPDGRILYRGRINDQYADLGVRRPHSPSADLASALDDILSGKPVLTARTKAIGCYISANG